MRHEDLILGELDAFTEAIPSGVERVEGDELNTTAQRPLRDEPACERGLSGAAASVDEHDRVRRLHRADGTDDRCAGRLERGGDRIPATS
jgi:hypothetical protein